MVKTIFINYSEKLSVPKKSQKSYRKGRDSGCELTMRDQNCYDPYVSQLQKARVYNEKLQAVDEKLR